MLGEGLKRGYLLKSYLKSSYELDRDRHYLDRNRWKPKSRGRKREVLRPQERESKKRKKNPMGRFSLRGCNDEIQRRERLEG